MFFAKHVTSIRRPHRNSLNLAKSTYRFTGEFLERRFLLANGLFGQLADGLAPKLDLLDAAMDGISQSTNTLPLIDKAATDLAEITDTFGRFKTQLVSGLRALDDPGNPASTASESAIQTAVFNVLGPLQLNILGDRAADGISASDVIVENLSGSSVRIRFDLAKVFNLTPEFGLGIDALPIKTLNPTLAALTLAMGLDDFNFGYSNGSFEFQSGVNPQLKFELLGHLPTTLASGLVGFMNVTLSDVTAEPDLSLALTMDVSSTGINNVRLNGNAAIHLGMEAGVSFTQYLPKVQGKFFLDWSFVNVDADGARADFGVPTAQFRDVGLNVRGVLESVTGPLLGYVADVLRPIGPVVDLLADDIPGISDITEYFGLPAVRLMDLIPPLAARQDIIDVLEVVDDLLDVFQQLDAFIDTGNADGAWLNLGNFSIGADDDNAGRGSGDSAADLLTAAPALIGAANGAWSTLVDLSTGGLPLGITDQINNLFPVEGGSVNVILFDTGTDSGTSSGSGVDASFPIVDDPRASVFKLLTGRDVSLVEIHAKIDDFKLFSIPVVQIPIWGPFFLKFNIALDFDLDATLGVDTRGIRQAATELFNGADLGTALGKLPASFYVGADTFADLDLSVQVLGSVDIGIVSANSGGTFGATLRLSLVGDGPNLDGDPSRIHPIAGIGGGELVPGEVTPGHLLRLEGIGTVGFHIDITFGRFPFSFSIGVSPEFNLFTFASVDIDPIFDPDPDLGDLDNGVLSLNIGPRAALRNAASGELNERLKIRQRAPGFVSVSGFGVYQIFVGVEHIVGSGSTGDDYIYIDAPSATVNIDGGSGSDFIRAVCRRATLHGGAGEDYLAAGPLDGGTLLTGGDDSDNIFARLRASGAAVTIDGGDGNDNMSLNPGDGGNALGAGSILIGGNGNDTANVFYPCALPAIDLGVGGEDHLVITARDDVPRAYRFDAAGLSIDNQAIPTSSAEFVVANGGDGNDIAHFNSPATNVQFNGKGGDDTGTLSGSNHLVNFFGDDGNDSFTALASQGNINALGDDGDDTFTLGDGSLFIPGGTFGTPDNYLKVRHFYTDGGEGADTFVVNNVNDTTDRTYAIDYFYDPNATPPVDFRRLKLDALSAAYGDYSYGDVDTLTLHQGSGDDFTTIAIDGDANSLRGFIVNTGAGDDTLNAALTTTSFGSNSRIDLGSGDDAVNFLGSSLLASSGAIAVEGGDGGDLVTVAGLFGPALTFINNGEPGFVENGAVDTLRITAPRVVHPIIFSGGQVAAGDGVGSTIIIDHSAVPASELYSYQTDRQLIPFFQGEPFQGELIVRAYKFNAGVELDRVVVRGIGRSIGNQIDFGRFNTTVLGNDANNGFRTTNTVGGDRVLWNGNGGDDRFIILNQRIGFAGFPVESFGRPDGQFTIVGGGGEDRLDYDRSQVPVGIIGGATFTDTDIQSASIGTVITAAGDIESRHYYGNNNPNVFDIAVRGSTTPLVVHGGSAVDTFNVDGLHGFGAVTLIGGDGRDKLIYNGGPAGGGGVPLGEGTINWTVTETSLSRTASPGLPFSSGAYALDSVESILVTNDHFGGTSRWQVSNTSTAVDILISGINRGIHYFYAGRAGQTLRQASVGKLIVDRDAPQSPAALYVTLDDTANTSGVIGHIDDFWIGARPNDTLTGNARYGLQFRGFQTGTLNLGSGNDTVYLTQDNAILWTVNGNGGVDSLTIAQRRSVPVTNITTPDGVFDQDPGNIFQQRVYLGPMTWTGMESVVLDNQLAEVQGITFDRDGARPAIVLRMNNVDLMPLAFTDQDNRENSRRDPFWLFQRSIFEFIPYSLLRSTIDNVNHTIRIEYLGNERGIFPDSAFEMFFSGAAIRTRAGNTLAFDAGQPPYNGINFSFRSLAGDANADGQVNFDDLLILSQNYGQPGRTFSQGNFDYSADGLVGFDDLLVLAQRYGTSLAIVVEPVKTVVSAKKRGAAAELITF